MTTTPNLALSYIASSQAQKEVTHNAALNDLDFLAKSSVIDYTISTPPASPNTGDAYIISASPTGAWTGFANYVAGYYGGWSIKPPVAGWMVWTRNGNRLLYYSGSAWALLDTPKLDATTTWAPGTIGNASGVTSAALTVTGAALGDLAIEVTASDFAPALGSWRVRVIKA